MDRALNTNERRRLRLRRLWMPALLIALGLAGLLLVPGMIRPRLASADLRTSQVRIGSVAATLGAEGRVTPLSVEVVTSSVSSRVVRILRRAGAAVEPGERILELDTQSVEAELESLDQEIALQRNAISAARLKLEQKLVDLDAETRIQKLELESLQFEVGRNEKMVESGLISAELLRQSRLDEERATIELERLGRSAANERRELGVSLEGLELEIGILETRRRDARQRLERAAASAGRAGVVTAVLRSEGEAVNEGDELARVADLSSFRVEAEFADVHAQELRVGLTARIRTGEFRLQGQVSRVLPSVENGAVRVEIDLEEPSHPILRQNLRVEVELVTAERKDVLVVERPTVVRHDGRRHLFVLADDRLQRRTVEIGIANRDSLEVRAGLAAGDEVVLDDMNPYAHHTEVLLK